MAPMPSPASSASSWPPCWSRRASEPGRQPPPPTKDQGPPLCVVDNYTYPTQHLQLKAGDRLCMVTDGVTEAMNLEGVLYGASRLQGALTRIRPDDSANAA